MKQVAAILICIFLGFPLLYIILKDKGKYQINTSDSIFNIDYETDEYIEDSINNKLTFIDKNLKKEIELKGFWIIKHEKQ